VKLRIGFLSLVLLGFVLSIVQVSGADGDGSDWEQHFQLHSNTFANKSTLPLSMIATINAPSTNTNTCTLSGAPGGDQSPELSWTDVPDHTRSFVVVTYDVTASFTHWGMYNISSQATGLPENAGIAGSSFGDQISNDFGDLSYDGPCPPTGVTPLVHQYVFTVYALNTKLPKLPAYGVFEPGAQALYHALIAAGRDNHILASASITGFYSAAAPPGQSQ
jgi:Raf kinase inhibitor-like YbhB/YbcL family protein